MSRLSRTNKFDELLDPSSFNGKSYSETTGNINVTIWPEFVDSKVSTSGDLFVWAYHVRIENKNDGAIQLNKRHWRIIDEKGDIEEVNGEGVVGEQPIIAAGAAYQYSSGVHLYSPSGIMSGKYFMKEVNGDEVLEVKIPTFSLDVPNITSVIN